MAHRPVKGAADLYESPQVWGQSMVPGQKNLLAAILDFWPADTREALDVGCGDGKITAGIARSTGCLLTGLDYSARALSRLAVRGVRGNAAALPFADAAFDVVLSTDTLEHLEQATHEAAWAEMFRVARDHVFVAVPFREELLEATTRCLSCHRTYHVNWHQRAYDLPDLATRAGGEWHLAALVLSGEPWSSQLPEEIHYRRHLLDEWSGWQESFCPHCEAPGTHAAPQSALRFPTDAALGSQIYTNLQRQRQWRSHSEVLAIFTRRGYSVGRVLPAAYTSLQGADSLEPARQAPVQDLHTYPQHARWLHGVHEAVAQFPVYGAVEAMTLQRVGDRAGSVTGRVEDGMGLLYEGELLAAGQSSAQIRFPRSAVPGAFGIILRSPSVEALPNITAGIGPQFVYATPPADGHGYVRTVWQTIPLHIQIPAPLWLDETALVAPKSDVLRPGELLVSMEALHARVVRQCEAQIDQLTISQQNLEAERNLLREQTRLADSHAVRNQNLEAERQLLTARLREQNALLVRLQNLEVENSLLLSEHELLDRLQVKLQNLQAERDRLEERAAELERLLVYVQNLEAERDILSVRSTELESALVRMQNLEADNSALLARAAEADRLAVTVQNLEAERQVLYGRAAEADRLAVTVQNVEAQSRKMADRLALTMEDSERLSQELVRLRRENEWLERELTVLRSRIEVRLGSRLRGNGSNRRANDTDDD